jgi:hypothetical protein
LFLQAFMLREAYYNKINIINIASQLADLI